MERKGREMDPFEIDRCGHRQRGLTKADQG